ncbi:PD40 domain-containing protein [Candidatus Peribacteria bacterium]|nr:PD40 domain-containing protein [Candidatus Peribacteria bacterium]
MNVGIITSTSRSENSSSSLQNEIIENASNPTYSPDGKSFAYVEKVGDKHVVVKDGVA